VAFDSSRGGEFNLARARWLDGKVKEQPLTSSPEYEARASIAATKDGKKLWIAAERGRRQWGRELRGHVGETGLTDRSALSSATLTSPPANSPKCLCPPTQALAALVLEVNLPVVATDAAGNPWIAYRYYSKNRWLIAVTKYDAAAKSWAQPMEVPDSSFGQDRHCTLVAQRVPPVIPPGRSVGEDALRPDDALLGQ